MDIIILAGILLLVMLFVMTIGWVGAWIMIRAQRYLGDYPE